MVVGDVGVDDFVVGFAVGLGAGTQFGIDEQTGVAPIIPGSRS